jgi:hypothetical protein
MERIKCFNKLARESLKNDLLIEVHTTVNNSAPGYASKLERMYKRNAEFPFFVKDIGLKDYFINVNLPAQFKMRDGSVKNDVDGKSVIFEAKAFDIYRLMAEIFDDGMDYATENHIDFYSIMSGDQLAPPNHATVLTKFLDEHPNAGLVGSIVFFDFSKKKMVRNGKTVEAYRPMVDMDTPEKTQWLWANLFPNEENGWSGLEFAEVRMVGTGGSMIPRSVFSQLRFHKDFNGVGEDIRYCEEIRSILGKKVFVHTGVTTPNLYENGEIY